MNPSGNLLTGATQFFNGSPPTAMLPVHSNGYDVGPRQHVVGSVDLPAEGFVFHSTTGMVDLTSFASTPGVTISLGTGVHGLGQITAQADVGGSTVGVLITP